MNLTPITTSEELQVFNFNGLQLRAKLIGGEPMFVLSDATKALNLTTPARVAERLRPKGMSKTHIPTTGGKQEVTIIDEGNLYRVIMRSNSPAAEPFETWIADEVLPTIRKTGSYETPKTLEQRSLELLGELTARVQEQQAELEEARPKAQVYDKVLTPEHTFGFRDLCKALREHFPINESDVKRLLRQKRILTTSDRLDVYSHAVDTGWAVRRPQGTWGGRERFSPRFTTKTLNWLLEELEPLEELSA